MTLMDKPILASGRSSGGAGAPQIREQPREEEEMDLRHVGNALLRQWVVLVVALLATVAVALGATVALPPTYQVSGTVVLVPPGGSGTTAGNPYDRFTSADHILAKVVLTAVTSQEVHDRISAENGVPYVVTTDAESPTITVTATGGDGNRTEATMLLVVETISEFLGRNQKATGTDPSTWFTLATINIPAAAKKTPSTIIIGAIVAALGVIASVSIAVIVDRAVMNHRRRLDGTRRPRGLSWWAVDPESSNATAAASHGESVRGGVVDDPKRP